ncbi:MAG TPA: hypothetical protein VL860_02535, partial [Planctomycetota bacterium]|nr:hypothetical protein [Planctomycetota bacterium]
ASLEKFLQSTDEYKDALKKWQDTDPATREKEPPSPYEALLFAVAPLLDLKNAFGARDHLVLTLKLPVEPKTNGVWDPGQKTVVWDKDITPSDGRLPMIAYAAWTVPDGDSQTAHFGGVVLAGDDLDEYCCWLNGLDAADRKEWDAFLTGLKPGPGLREALDGFRFTRDPREGPSLFDEVRKQIESGLEAEEKPATQPREPGWF